MGFSTVNKILPSQFPNRVWRKSPFGRGSTNSDIVHEAQERLKPCRPRSLSSSNLFKLGHSCN